MKIRLVVIYLAIGCFCAATEFLIFFVLRNLLSVGIVTIGRNYRRHFDLIQIEFNLQFARLLITSECVFLDFCL